MEDPKVILLCCSRFAFPLLQWLQANRQLGVVIVPRHCGELADDIDLLLDGSGVPVLRTGKKEFEEKAIAAIQDNQVNTGLVATFSFMVPPAVFNLPAKGFYNIHPGPLPAYRGADPIFHQVKNREKRAAVTIHQLTEEADSGPVVIAEQVALAATDTYGLLAAKLADLAAKLAANLLKILGMGFDLPVKPQDESVAVYYPPQQPHAFAIDWNTMDADDIIALILACNPHNKGAAARFNNKIIRLVHAEKMEEEEIQTVPPGTILKLWPDYMELATAGNSRLKVDFIWIEEGFFSPGVLLDMGVTKGTKLESIYFKGDNYIQLI